MIVLKSSQDKLLSVLLSVTGIIESRNKLLSVFRSVTGIIEVRKVLPLEPNDLALGAVSADICCMNLLRSLSNGALTPQKFHGQIANQAAPLIQNMGFFSAQKLNMRNAP